MCQDDSTLPVSSPMDIPPREQHARDEDSSDEDCLSPTQFANSYEESNEAWLDSEVLRDRELEQGHQLYVDLEGNTCVEECQMGVLERATDSNNFQVHYNRLFTEHCSIHGCPRWTSLAKPKKMVWHLELENTSMRSEAIASVTVALVLDLDPQEVCPVHDTMISTTGCEKDKRDCEKAFNALELLILDGKRYRFIYKKKILYNVAVHNDDLCREELTQTCLEIPLEDMQRNYDVMMKRKYGCKEGTFLVEENLYYMIKMKKTTAVNDGYEWSRSSLKGLQFEWKSQVRVAKKDVQPPTNFRMGMHRVQIY